MGARRLPLALGLAALVAAGPAHALRVVTWNIHAYDTATNTISWRQASFRTVMTNIDADVVIVQELLTSAAQDSFYYDVLDVVQPGQWTKGSYQTGTKTPQSAVFWKPSKATVTTIGQVDDGGPRNVLFCVVKPLGYLTNPGWFRLYSMHLKAGGPATADSTTRRLECTSLRSTLNATTSQGPNFLLGGDTNFYSAFEGGYIRLTESQTGVNGNNGRCYDTLGTVMGSSDWHVNASFAAYDTQSPCNVCPDVSFSGGGMDDRFDIMFSSTSLADGQGVEMVDYIAYGEDGLHFNDDINAPPPNAAVGQAVADALWGSSDHLPVVAVVQLASRVVAESAVNFGSVIVGATAQQTLHVSDGGVPPVDALDYSFAGVPPGFTAPAGSFTVPNGSTHPHPVGMDTSAPGARTGTLTMSTDDPDSASKPVRLAGTVLDHAQPSLDSLVALAADTIDWGTRPQGAFGDSTVRVFDRGYGPLRARLSIGDAVISGGSGRFSLVGASFPLLAAATGVPFTVHFDDSGVATDSTFEATLAFTTADEPLPGATALTPLVVTLRAHRVGNVGVGDGVPRPLAFLAPRPNPLSLGCTLGFDLPRTAAAELAIFDLSGRRVATLADGMQGSGRHLLRWDATDTGGMRVGAGIYFARFQTQGMSRTARLVVLP